MESPLSIKDASGRQISLLNNSTYSSPSSPPPPPPAPSTDFLRATASRQSSTGRRKYHCTEPGCNKSFTTSGHLARHNRIHTGEKNFHCLYPGCPSRFSRQDNMMQHYRTHLSPKSRRNHQLTRNIKQHQLSRPCFEPYPSVISPLNSPLDEQPAVLPQLMCSPSPSSPTSMKLQPLEPSTDKSPPLYASSAFLCPTPPLSPPHHQQLPPLSHRPADSFFPYVSIMS
ncbi:hypothetical protein BDB00DRAFT_982325 [Zychaea mexicana]|uniref:uncharacterized protein n=1 Tax=Zychaea mexicana TaxID=64656 RepID=UPI0022FE82FE|nr:uncharacterized protein BDB00DRAFT_982325 [Zychaea mexicana]KAI9488482.1 hypothetical protein BDB00DRAFT_982325 [Zychaea mexicana]